MYAAQHTLKNMHHELTRFIFMSFVLIVSACQSESEFSEQLHGRHIVYDTSPINVANFPNNPEILQHIVTMPFGEFAQRLKAAEVSVQTKFIFTHQGTQQTQITSAVLKRDAEKNSYIRMNTPIEQIEVYGIGSHTYLRRNVGALREQAAYDNDPEQWEETAFSQTYEALGVFAPHLTFGQPKSTQIMGRNAFVYAVSIQQNANPEQNELFRPKESLLPKQPLPLWSEHKKPKNLEGMIWVDAQTGCLLKAHIEGKLMISPPNTVSTELVIIHDRTSLQLQKMPLIQAPKAIHDFRRAPAPPNPSTLLNKKN